MIRKPLLAGIVALAVASQSFAAGGFVKSVAAAQKSAKADKSLIFVDLFAAWCGWCHRFDQEVVPSEAFQKVTDDMVLLRLDTEDRGEGTAIAQKFQIHTLPTFLVLDYDLTLAGVIRGYAPPSEFARMVTETVSNYRNFQRTVKQEGSFPRDYKKRLDLAKSFFGRQSFAQAEERFKKLIKEDGVPLVFRDEAYLQLSLLYLQQSKYAQALKTINDFAAVQNRGESFERSRLVISDVYVAQGNFRSAVESLREFKARFPQSQYVAQVNALLPGLERQLLVR